MKNEPFQELPAKHLCGLIADAFNISVKADDALKVMLKQATFPKPAGEEERKYDQAYRDFNASHVALSKTLFEIFNVSKLFLPSLN